MDSAQMTFNKKTAEHLIKNLQKRRMAASYAPTAEQAKKEVLDMVPDGYTVYRCGSMTTTNMGLWEELSKRPGVKVIGDTALGLSPEEKWEKRRTGLMADVLITSTNAITIDGRLVNLDGYGNRVGAMIFGPKKVILVVGMNKVAPDLETAMARVKHYAAPANVIRLGYEAPCRETGLCVDCRSPQRICNMWSIIEGHMEKDRIHVKLVGEHLGY